MPTFRTKPIIIDAFRLGRKEQPTPAPEWFGSPDPKTITEEGLILQGNILASWGDWIIRDIKGKIYPCKPDIFELTYELTYELMTEPC